MSKFKSRYKDRQCAMSGLKDRLAPIISTLGGEPAGARLIRLWQNWAMVMGEELAPIAKPLGVRQDTILIGTIDHILLQELTYYTPEILERVNAFMDSQAFNKVELQLISQKTNLECLKVPSLPPRQKPIAPPSLTKRYLEKMQANSPVTMAYIQYLKTHNQFS